MLEAQMNKSSVTLSPGWHIPVVLVLTFAVASPFMSMALPHAAHLTAQGQAGLATYFNALGVAVWLISLFVLLPRRRNTSRFIAVRALGRLPLIARYFVAFGLAAGLFWFGILVEKFTA